ncbi:prealbumin-like fold domain-containing protein [Lysobacter antibioticus]|uniref:prealbumin-like fold domain-containing protein n=1 Tax=Lysobacter antibioticus TaxID=84531 RepID=UPI0004D003ED|nr:GEVED domain-containing protein [Lysobacter antibioticus]
MRRPATAWPAPPATSPRASTNAAGDTDNAFASLPIVGVGTYSLSVPVAGFQTVSGASPQLCGWIDFNRNGTFETGERACAGVTGNGNVALNWTIPTGATYVAGESYARLRLGYTTSQVQNATGLADSGEVEDYPITLLPRVRLTKALVPTSDPGLFNLSVAPASATAVQTNSGTVANVGNGGTTDWVPVPLGTLITVSETAGTSTSLSNYTSSIACTDRSGAAVTLGAAGTTRTFFSLISAPVGPPTTPNSANANLSEISCTATNARLPTLQVVKVTQNGVGTFSFSGTNGIANHDITTVTAGTGVAGPVQLLTAAGTATTVTEAPLPVGYLLGGISCSGLGAGGNATVDLPNRSVSLDAAATAAGSAIVCTFTNIAQVADLAITKTNTPLAGDSDQANDTLVRGASTQYSLRVINNGPVSVTGAVVRDTPGAGLNCPSGNVVSCSSVPAGACPGPILMSDLTAGVPLGTLSVGTVATLTFSCTVL